jgi:RNA polymerase sigma-70 factor, ECF subfamily
MIRLHTANTCEGGPSSCPPPYEEGARGGFRGTHRTTGASPPKHSPRQYVDFSGVKAPPLLILWKGQARAALDQPRVNDRKKLMSNTDTRHSIILGACRGDPERWRQFNAVYRPMLFAFLRKQRLSESDADDVVQDTFLKLLDKIQTYDREKCKFRSWLFAVAHNALVDKARRRASYKKAIDGWAADVLRSTASDSTKLAEAWVKHHRAKILTHALETVRAQTSAKVWGCFEQRLLRGQRAADIARELGIENPGTVHVNAHRVLKRVRAVCQDFDEDLIDDDDSRLS